MAHQGSCHCGAVRYEVDLDLAKGVNRCNCTICTKLQLANIIVKPEAFRLLAGKDRLIDYKRPEGVNNFPFCNTCGAHPFGTGHLDILGGDYVSVNATTLDGVDLAKVTAVHWDGRNNNWQSGTRGEPWPI